MYFLPFECQGVAFWSVASAVAARSAASYGDAFGADFWSSGIDYEGLTFTNRKVLRLYGGPQAQAPVEI